jgi:hypothetical protein
VCVDYGTYSQLPPWSNEIISKTVKAIGYYHICQTDNISTVRAQFIKMYNEFREGLEKDVLTRVAFSATNEMISLPTTTTQVSSSIRSIGKGTSE